MQPERSRGFPLRVPSRREMLRDAASGFDSLAFLGLNAHSMRTAAAQSGEENPLAPRPSLFKPRAKHVIFLFMHGGVSHVDTFDPKPKLDELNGQPYPGKLPLVFANPDSIGNLLKSPWNFRQYGQSGLPVSDLFPQVASCIDDICVIRSLSHDRVSHGAAMQEIHTGSGVFQRPAAGSWIVYGLGSENQNLPGFITICAATLDGGTSTFGSAFLPAAYQGTRYGETSSRGRYDDARRAAFKNLRPGEPNIDLQRMELDFMQQINRRQSSAGHRDSELEARIASFELAFRMQAEAPEATDLSSETEETFALYGVNQGSTDNFGRQCLLARRFVERGVRFVQATHSYKWDQHGGLHGGHTRNALEVDQPIAALLKDLKRRGLLDETIVIWATEFGRTPVAQSKNGRDHSPYGFSMWMAGGGIKGGMAYGATDELGYFAVENKVTIHDLYATVLNQLGLDHAELTYHYSGRDFSLTDVEGDVIHEII